MTFKLSLLSAAAYTAIALPASAVPQLTPFGMGTTAAGVSGDGTTVVGFDSAGGFLWTASGGKLSVPIPAPSGVSRDGSVVAGSTVDGIPRGVRWIKGASAPDGITPLGSPAPIIPPYSRALGISGDGNTVVGICSSANTNFQAYRWSPSTTTGIGDLTGGTISSTAYAVSDDGSVIVGESDSASGKQAFVKSGSAAMLGLGDLPAGAFSSSARGVSPDGGTVVGVGSTTVLGIARTLGFRWTAAAGMKSLSLPTTTETGVTFTGSQADAASSNGDVVVGFTTKSTTTTDSDGIKTTTTINAGTAWFGTSTKRISEVALTGGINAVDEFFGEVVSISANSDTIVGNGKGGGWVITGARPLFGLSSTDPVLPKVSVQVTGSNPVVTFDTVPGQSYQVQRSADLSGAWVAVDVPFSTVGQSGAGTHSVTDTTSPASDKAFYRVLVQPAS
jgi:probable HAF family extracellular repeat protein